MIAFGWSVGDLVFAVKIAARVISTIRIVDGAVSKYAEEVAFFNSLNAAFRRLEEVAEAGADSEIPEGAVVDVRAHLAKIK